MGLLFVFLTVIVIIILIARMASKTRPETEKVASQKKTGLYTVKKLEGPSPDRDQVILLEALISVLIQKKVISEEEVAAEIKSIIDKKEDVKKKKNR